MKLWQFLKPKQVRSTTLHIPKDTDFGQMEAFFMVLTAKFKYRLKNHTNWEINSKDEGKYISVTLKCEAEEKEE